MDGINTLWSVIAVKGIGVAACGYVLVHFLVWYRTGSVHLLLRSLWGRLIAGKSEKPKQLHAFLEEYTGLLEFRFTTGLKKIRTKAHANVMLAWLIKHDEDIGKVAACREYFDFEEMGLRAPFPKAWTLPFQAAFTVLLALVVVALVTLSLQSAAIIRLNGSDDWILLGQKGAKPFSNSGFLYAECRKDPHHLSARTKIPQEGIKEICQEVDRLGDNLGHEIRKIVSPQRILLGYFALVFIVPTVTMYRTCSALRVATEMKKRLEKRKALAIDAGTVRH
ncbi:DUF6216 family protein [Herbaspirillum huttiense]|uniref:DUF6216 family protein n=2 Tax=Herbaspirillum huttiense TaxID=863372 RepID=A0AAJ2HAP9_9BURK|nr:DUF6216 family protein [Herbaspirillum huttiense]MDR9837734.1 DUF6216 family protein [Herbaspirillum huttiense]